MSLVEWNPFRDVDGIGREMANFLERTPFRFFSGMNAPRVDVYQSDGEVVMKAEIPGVQKEDLNVYIDENTIRLSGRNRKNEEFKDENIYRSERYYGSFSRTISLPSEVKAEEAKAEYRDGILTITAPKVKPEKSRGRRVDIN